MEAITKADLLGLRDSLIEIVTAGENRLREQIVEHLESMGTQQSERFRAIDARFDAIERRLSSIDEQFLSVNERFATMQLSIDQLTARVVSEVTDLRNEIARLSIRVDHLTEKVDRISGRLDRVDSGLLHFNERFDGLSSDMRQRFRIVNDRLAALVAA